MILIRFGGHPGQAQNVRRSPRAHDDDVFGTAPLRAWLGTTRPAPADPLTTDERTELAQLRREMRQLRVFFPSLKTDLNHRVWVTRADALREIGSYIDDFDNTRRLHSTLGYRSPVAFEQRRGTAA